MLTRTRLVAGLVSLACMTGLALAAPASGEPNCEKRDKDTGQCVITIEVAPVRPATDTSEQQPRGKDDMPRCLGSGDRPVPCTDPFFGTWSNTLQCYSKLAEPQPDPSSELWEGNYPRGAIYDCVVVGTGPFSKVARLWLPGPPAAAALSPEAAARIVVRRMDLRAASIGIVPEDKPGSIGAVGAPVYMWTGRGPATFGPQVLIGSAGGVTITATAKVDRIVWDMGDGASVTCRTPGTPYEDRYGFAMSPDCGHRYSRTSAGRSGNAYPVTATSFWLVDWTGPGGSSGQIPLTLSSSTAIQVGELQALVTRR